MLGMIKVFMKTCRYKLCKKEKEYLMTIETENGCIEVFKPQDMTLPIQNLFEDLWNFVLILD